ncbi:hypothetical protein Psi01_18160 [Planobispora siamensis]|uniref:Uncharacterized protein n=1 Tax=Planobispora siamensis TaxID=936338 RepID=A0A8J3WKU4_9ACTN|nr:hypothetical protein Psi01_18160 [Planobispora siamensis]
MFVEGADPVGLRGGLDHRENGGHLLFVESSPMFHTHVHALDSRRVPALEDHRTGKRRQLRAGRIVTLQTFHA